MPPLGLQVESRPNPIPRPGAGPLSSAWLSTLAPALTLTSRIVRLVGVIRDWANKNFREEEPRPDSFLERFRGPELQTVTTQQGDGKGDKDGEGKATKYSCAAWERGGQGRPL